ncbi:MAG: sigma-70 family RNA polymerase sigma factor [Microlunatus sp.]|nr:sigma-70 family RNA polymerase sigma factor [Microlunatus sp.]
MVEAVERMIADGAPVGTASQPSRVGGGMGDVARPASTVAAEIAAENEAWISGLTCAGTRGDQTRRQLFDFLLRAARVEAHWRSTYTMPNGPELDDLAHQAAADAMIAVVEKIDGFRGDCRFTTWAYRFAALIVSSKIRRHPWHKPNRPLHAEEWLDSPAWSGDQPEVDFEAREMVAVFHRVVTTDLTPRQREVLIASIVDGTRADDLAQRLGSNRNAIYKVLFDARHKISNALRAEGFAGPSR